MNRQIPLPIDGVLPQLAESLKRHAAVILTAPPGSGKTTRVPPAVARQVEGRVLLLQPRRVAARSCARRIAEEDGTRLGQRVGYWVRFDRKFSAETEILVVTEGLLTRLLQADPFLEGVGAVILDEFHERSLHSDLAMSMLAEVVRDVRPDLKLVVMSATLDAEPIQAFLGGSAACPVISAEGRCFDVDIIHAPLDKDRWLEPQVARIVREAVAADSEGHVLVFLPGVGEIERVRTHLGDLGPETEVMALHGRLRSADQDRAIGPSKKQKVVLATNIAETSLTIDGVTTVVDAGLARRPRFDPRLGVERLETVQVSLASAAQRAGRAGRTRAGRCIRLWSESSHGLRDDHEPPSIALADLASTVLDLMAWGTTPDAFGWFEAPPKAAISHATGLLTQLGALSAGNLTAVGSELARLPVHPRLGRVVLRGVELGVLHEAAGAAALASERDPWSGEAVAELLTRLDWLDSRENTGADRRALAAVKRVRDDLVRLGQRATLEAATERPRRPVVAALVAGFPDRVGQRREKGGRAVLLASGVGVELGRGVSGGDWMVAVTLTAGERGRSPVIRVAAELEPSLLDTDWEDEVTFDKDRESVTQRCVRRWGAIVLAEKPTSRRAQPADVTEVLAAAAQPRFSRLFPEADAYGALLARLRFAVRVSTDDGWPEWIASPELLLEDWCMGRRSFAELRKLDLVNDLLGRLPWGLRKQLDVLAPQRMEVPSGAHIQLEYPADKPPILSARVQQLFGMMKTPKLGGVSIMVHLLAPNGRPAQVTQDLEGFWSGTYAEVRKDLRGRYPKHAWPEDPSTAIPENRPRRKRR